MEVAQEPEWHCIRTLWDCKASPEDANQLAAAFAAPSCSSGDCTCKRGACPLVILMPYLSAEYTPYIWPCEMGFVTRVSVILQ